ncbi:ankyrin repeat-containing domain protein [Lasiosphaeria hispida]|uniref:Ankyrin repeat-containing domain protein n=1 Tax=Lasiosphaeria hispida TaxID=260671 RepID=A0AAJ0HCK0_9PEZI|nr:ankyrin repeat-containing domain protein [Lasiosphaeria hispida]
MRDSGHIRLQTTMARQVPVHEKGFTLLYKAPQPMIDIVFVHGFTGHPRDTWTLKDAKPQLVTRAKKHGREDDPAGPARHSKIRKLFSPTRSSPGPSTVTLPVPSSGPALAKEGTSATRQDDVYWPADLACKTIPNSRILTYGYDTKVRHRFAGPVSKNCVYDHARDLLCSFEPLRRNPDEACRPILFVAHSLGGIIVKEVLRISRGYETTVPELRRIYEFTSGIMFFGTPHGGADPRDLIHHALSALIQTLGFQVNHHIVSTLMPDSEHLTQLRDEFSIMCHEREWLVYSFQEEYGVAALSGKKVVSDNSSCLNNPTLERKQHISSNHMDMCRFSGLQDQEYLKVAAAMTHIVGVVENSARGMGHEQPLALRLHQDIELTPPVPKGEHMSALSPIAEDQPQDIWLPQGTPFTTEESRTQVSHGIPDIVKQVLVEQLYFAKIDERLTSLTAAQGTTCRWFLAKPEYSSWRDAAQRGNHGGFLWIKGNPGTGKSTLIKLLFEEAKRGTGGSSSRIVLSFFFLARGTAEEKSTTGLYRSLLHQLFNRAADLKDSVEWMTSDGAKGIQATGWHEEALKQTLAEAIRRLGARSLTIFVDALDECDDSQAEGMVSFCEELCAIAQAIGVQLHICFSSRHYPHIEIKGIEVILEDEVGHLDDIKQYIRSRLRLRKSKAAELLQSEIVEKSSLIFLWVVLVVDILNRDFPLKPVGEMGKRLKEIPRGLSDLFEMILTRDGQNPELLQLSLQWVLFATRPLKPQELYFAIQFGLGKKSSGYWDQESMDLGYFKTFVTSSSKGLAEVTRKASEVQFIHESVRDFLLGKYGTQWSGVSNNYAGHGHQVLRDCCLSQLNTATNSSVGVQDTSVKTPMPVSSREMSQAVRREYPFLDYSVHNVLRHANDAQKHGMEQTAFLDDFPLQQWITLHNTLEKFPVRQHKESVGFLYILAQTNSAELIKKIPLRTGSCFHAGPGRYGPPILAAIVNESSEAVQALLEAEARAHPPESLLHEVCKQHFGRREGLTKLSRDFIFSKQRNLISYIAEYGDAAVIDFFLSWDRSELESKDKQGWTPLSYAARGGHVDVIKRLLKMGAEIESTDGQGRTPLINAAIRGQDASVKFLIERGAKINASEKGGGTLLYHATNLGHEATVRLLLDNGDDVEAILLGGEKCLALAASNGHSVVVKLLLERGAKIESKNRHGQTPLSYAARNAETGGTTRLLLENGAEIESKDKSGRTPLSWAAMNSHTAACLKVLLEMGAEIESKDKSGRTPLSWAAMNPYAASCLKVLLEMGAEIESKDEDGRTPLSWAATYRSDRVEELLEKGAEIESKDEDGRTPLSWAVTYSSDRVKELLEKGAETESKDKSGRTPLSWAAAVMHSSNQVKELLEKGAEIESKDKSGRTPLSWAATNPHTAACLKVLLEKGAEIESKDEDGRTPLSWAVATYSSDQVKELLEKGAASE